MKRKFLSSIVFASLTNDFVLWFLLNKLFFRYHRFYGRTRIIDIVLSASVYAISGIMLFSVTASVANVLSVSTP